MKSNKTLPLTADAWRCVSTAPAIQRGAGQAKALLDHSLNFRVVQVVASDQLDTRIDR